MIEEVSRMLQEVSKFQDDVLLFVYFPGSQGIRDVED